MGKAMRKYQNVFEIYLRGSSIENLQKGLKNWSMGTALRNCKKVFVNSSKRLSHWKSPEAVKKLVYGYSSEKQWKGVWTILIQLSHWSFPEAVKKLVYGYFS